MRNTLTKLALALTGTAFALAIFITIGSKIQREFSKIEAAYSASIEAR